MLERFVRIFTLIAIVCGFISFMIASNIEGRYISTNKKITLIGYQLDRNDKDIIIERYRIIKEVSDLRKLYPINIRTIFFDRDALNKELDEINTQLDDINKTLGDKQLDDINKILGEIKVN